MDVVILAAINWDIDQWFRNGNKALCCFSLLVLKTFVLSRHWNIFPSRVVCPLWSFFPRKSVIDNTCIIQRQEYPKKYVGEKWHLRWKIAAQRYSFVSPISR